MPSGGELYVWTVDDARAHRTSCESSACTGGHHKRPAPVRARRRSRPPGDRAHRLPAPLRRLNDGDPLDLLRRVPVFETLGREDLQRVAHGRRAAALRAGQVIFREGDASDTCYIVRTGHARAIREHADGRTITLAHFGPGDIFGELAMFDDERRSATVEALDDARGHRDPRRRTCAA